MLSSGLQHNYFFADDCPRFRIIQHYFTRLWINFFSLGWCFLPKNSHIAIPSGFNAPWFNTAVPGGILGNRNVGDQATPLSPLTLLQESFVLWWCNQIQISMQARLPKSNLACHGAKKFNSITPSADGGNWQIKNEWLKVTNQFKLDLLFPHDIQAVSRYSERFKCSTFELYLRYPRLQTLQLDPESTMRIRSTPWILTATVGVPWSRVTGIVTKLLTALAGNLRWKLLLWIPSATSCPDDGCFDE